MVFPGLAVGVILGPWLCGWLEAAAREGYGRRSGLEPADVAVDGCPTKAESLCVHLEAGYDSCVTRVLLAERGLDA